MELTQARLKEAVSYEAETGKFAWRQRRRGRRPISHRSYCIVHIDGRPCALHRMAWIYVYGSIPDGMQIDHINRDTTDTRIANLRLATPSQNLANCRVRKHSTSGLKGAHLEKGRYCARITHQGTRYRLGIFDTPEEAHQVYVAAAQRLFGEFARAA